MAEYARQVLDAMGIENGPGHMEVMRTWMCLMMMALSLLFFLELVARANGF